MRGPKSLAARTLSLKVVGVKACPNPFSTDSLRYGTAGSIKHIHVLCVFIILILILITLEFNSISCPIYYGQMSFQDSLFSHDLKSLLCISML